MVDDERDNLQHARWMVHRWLVWEWTQGLVVFVIFLNCIAVGSELQFGHTAGGNDDFTVYEQLEMVFQVFYAAELFARFFAYGWKCLRCHWVKFDAMVVFAGFVEACILRPLNARFNLLVTLRAWRLMRLFRLVRALKWLVQYREMAILVNGVLSSVGTMFYTLIMLGVMLFIFACTGQQLVGEIASDADIDAALAELVSEHFGTVMRSMLTLLQFVCMDGLADIYKPVIMYKPWLAAYFVSAMIFIGIVLMNLITAVMVNSAIDKAEHNKALLHQEAKRKAAKLSRQLQTLFVKLDRDGSSGISRDEFIELAVEHDVLQDYLPDMTPLEVYEAIDVDGNGIVDKDEFCQGIKYLVNSNISPEMRRMATQLDATHSHLKNLIASHEHLAKHLHLLEWSPSSDQLEGEVKEDAKRMTHPRLLLSQLEAQSLAFGKSLARNCADELAELQARAPEFLAATLGRNPLKSSSAGDPTQSKEVCDPTPTSGASGPQALPALLFGNRSGKTSDAQREPDGQPGQQPAPTSCTAAPGYPSLHDL